MDDFASEDLNLDLDASSESPRRVKAHENGRSQQIPDVVIRRLPVYGRALDFIRENGIEHVSSEELGERIGFSAAQIRRDLSYFGEFGKQGKGYNVEFLLGKVKEILQLDRGWNVAVIGAGHLGRALARYEGFQQNGFYIAAVFDHNPKKVGQRYGELVVLGMDQLSAVLDEQQIRIAVLAVPPQAAQHVADQLVAAGIRAILSYVPMMVKVPAHVAIRHIDPVVSLQSMTYYLERPGSEESEEQTA